MYDKRYYFFTLCKNAFGWLYRLTCDSGVDETLEEKIFGSSKGPIGPNLLHCSSVEASGPNKIVCWFVGCGSGRQWHWQWVASL